MFRLQKQETAGKINKQAYLVNATDTAVIKFCNDLMQNLSHS